MPDHDTIAAIATASGRSGIGVVRVSGKMLAPFAAALTGKTPAPRVAALSTFRASDGSPIDQGITLYFRAPHSYTGEDVLELQGHGGPVVLQWLLKRCVELGARVAAPGEFTKRAFLNGKLDLAQAESVADLIDASTEAAARSAILSLTGYFSEQIQILNSKCIELRALLEATLDFPEEEIDNMTKQGVEARLADLRTQLLRVLAASEQGSLLREGVHIVLAGQPNVGKSSLLNRLAGDEIAIVTDIPGTTRDAIRQTINLEGVPAHIIDTAGLRETNDPVERLGVARTWAAIEKADLVLLIIDARIGDTAADRAILAKLPQGMVCLRVLNKVDLTQQPVARMESPATVWLSAKTGAGVDMLKTAMLDIVGWHGGDQGIFLARARHLDALRTAHKHLEQATTEIGRPELCAEDLRLAHEALGAITGEYTSDDLLGEIFSRFCIGK